MRFRSPLDRVRIAAPCKADWTQMRGDERVRFCDHCKLHVYNLSALTKREAQRLVTSTEDRLCVRFYRRADGTILTHNCPVGLRAIKRRVAKIAGVVFAVVTSLLPLSRIEPAPRNVMPDESPAPVANESAVAMGYTMSETLSDPLGDQYAAGVLLGSVVFLFGYPLMKIRERREARRSKALHIWRG